MADILMPISEQFWALSEDSHQQQKARMIEVAVKITIQGFVLGT